MYRAYETLPEDLKRKIEGKKAMNIAEYNIGTINSSAIERLDNPDPNTKRHAHPIVRTHPATGRRALYVNRLLTAYIEDMPREESDAVLNALFDHQERREFVYEHVWTPGDLVIWDNRCTVHARTDFDASERRLLRRVIVLGETPV
jgi:taurine dioxygenase